MADIQGRKIYHNYCYRYHRTFLHLQATLVTWLCNRQETKGEQAKRAMEMCFPFCAGKGISYNVGGAGPCPSKDSHSTSLAIEEDTKMTAFVFHQDQVFLQ